MQEQILVLYKEGMLRADIAIALDIPESTVYNTLCVVATETYRDKYSKWLKSKAKKKPKQLAHYHCYCAEKN